MNNGKLKYFLVGCGCAALAVILSTVGVFLWLPVTTEYVFDIPGNEDATTQQAFAQSEQSTPIATPSLIQTEVSPAPIGTSIVTSEPSNLRVDISSSEYLSTLYQAVSPGVVSIFVTVTEEGRTGQAGGSGFVFDEEGHIVTNNHVVENADIVVIVFQDGSEALADVVGTDRYSDLAVVKVDQLPESARPLPLGDSNEVETGDWAIAIGNPFGLNSSMSIGIISAIGRTIPSGAASFAIPMAIQTDAAINPGNSGGPLLNLQGQVIGVNAQIASNSVVASNAGVGFSIPSEIVRRVVPTLIEVGVYQWSWLGIEGASVNLFIAEGNDLPTAHGVYVASVIPGGPAEQAGIRGGVDFVSVNGLEVPTGGDVIIQADGMLIIDYAALQALIAQKKPDDEIELVILRDGERQTITVPLAPRPDN
jgi:2-alkenal reductase